MTLKKISHNQLLENMASLSLSFGMNNIKIPGREHLTKKVGELIEANKPDKSITVGLLVYNAYIWGQEYQQSIESDKLRKETK